jgi:hypothetical protein
MMLHMPVPGGPEWDSGVPAMGATQPNDSSSQIQGMGKNNCY